MDMNLFRSLFTLVLFVIFIAIVLWAWSKRRRKAFDEAANLPFADDDIAKRSAAKSDDKESEQ